MKKLQLLFILHFSFFILHSQSWIPLGKGIIGGGLTSLAVYNGNLIAGGYLDTTGGNFFKGIATWDGTSWSTLGGGVGGPNPIVQTLCIFNDSLIAGGYFSTAGGRHVNAIAGWNGSSWFGLDGGMGVFPVFHLGDTGVYSTAIYNNNLIAGGFFSDAGGDTAYSIAQWNGTAWGSLGGGITFAGIARSSTIFALCEYNGNLIAGGYFDLAGGKPAKNIAQWNGTSWDSIGSGLYGNYGEVSALAVYNGNLIAGGSFDSAGGKPTSPIVSWNGTSWDPLGKGINGIVYALYVYNGVLYAGGSFDTAGGVAANSIAAWDGTTWSPLGSGLSGGGENTTVASIIEYNNNLYVAGYFDTAGGVPANNIAEWTTCNLSGKVTLNFQSQDTICKNAGSVKLFTNPAGGILQGKGVYGSNFYPDSAKIGVYNIFTYTYTDTNGCSATVEDSLYVDDCTEAQELKVESGELKVVPNPNDGRFTIQGNSEKVIGNSEIQIYNVYGQEVYSSSFKIQNSKLTCQVSRTGFITISLP